MDQIPAGAIPEEQFQAQQAPQQSQEQIPPGAIPEDEFQESPHESIGQQVLTGVEGAARGIGGPLATMEERILSNMGVPGLSGKEQLAREQANPIISGASEAAGFGAGALMGEGLPKVLGKVGEAAQAAAGLGEAVSTGQKLAAAATRGAAEMAAFQASDETSKYLQDAPQTVGGVVSNIGLSALLGGAVGPLFTGGGMLAKSALDTPELKEFADRLAFRKSNIDPNEMIKNEAENTINTYRAMNDEINGPQGMKAQALKELMPEETNNKIMNQIQDMGDKSEKAIAEMRAAQVPERYITKFQNDANRFLEQVTKPDVTPLQTFDALNEYKKTLQGYSKGNFGPFAIPSYHEAYDFLNITKGLGFEARTALEDSKIWGKVADLQKELNASWTKALPAAKDFEKKFMTKVGDESIISGDKFNTYMNQAGKATNITDRQKMLGNFIDAMSNHFDTVDKIYQAAGVENPFQPVGMSTLKESLNKPSIGSKLADMWHDKLSHQSLGSAAGALVGGKIGAMFGEGLGGVYLGKEVLGPVFANLIKPMLEKYPNVDLAAFKQAIALSKAAIKGDTLLTNATHSLFEASNKAFPSNVLPTPEKLVALNDKVKQMNGDYQEQADMPGKTGYYLPNHGSAIAKTTGDVVSYLNSKRPENQKLLPLDQKQPVSQMQKVAFNRTLAIAQQPLTVIKFMKEGRLTISDVQDLKSMYPEYYQRMQQKMFNSIAEQTQHGHKVPYETRQMMALFLGQPMDSSMMPASIQSSQAIYAPKAPQQPQGAPKKKGTSSLGKTNKTYQTASQSAESDRSGRD